MQKYVEYAKYANNVYKFLQNMQLICKYRCEYVHKNAKNMQNMQNMQNHFQICIICREEI